MKRVQNYYYRQLLLGTSAQYKCRAPDKVIASDEIITRTRGKAQSY